MTYTTNRPKRAKGQGDAHLRVIAKDLQRKLAQAQRDFAYDSLSLKKNELGVLAGVLVDFAEDLHNEIGLWNTLEQYNIEFFGTPLPLTSPHGKATAATGIHADRIRHLLWIIYPALIDGLVLSPIHKDLVHLADTASAFLRERFASVPRDSGVQAFLQTPNEHGWDVKRKLIWLGTHSYMFRIFFANYVAGRDNDAGKIGYTDDFICQECTRWSGLGVIDILAGVLDISDDDRRDLRSWYERHTAFYKLHSVSDETLEAVNVISDQPYDIRIDMARHPFERGQLVFGSLVPWRGDWYWSGEQQLWGDASDVDVDDIKQAMKRKHSQIICRYWKEYEALVRRRAAELHDSMMAFYGKGLIEYPDGLSMAADWQKEFRFQWESKDPQQVQEIIREHELKDCRPEMPLPPELLEHRNGFGVFINPDEGKEIVQDFTSVIAGLNCRGNGLSDEEANCLRGFFESDTISPKFVNRVLQEYGSDSIKAAFVLTGDQPNYWLDYLLRSYKGQYFRKRYPFLSVI